MEKFGVQGTTKRKDRTKAKANARKQGERGASLGDIRRLKRRCRNGKLFEKGIPAVERRKKMHRCALVATQ